MAYVMQIHRKTVYQYDIVDLWSTRITPPWLQKIWMTCVNLTLTYWPGFIQQGVKKLVLYNYILHRRRYDNNNNDNNNNNNNNSNDK